MQPTVCHSDTTYHKLNSEVVSSKIVSKPGVGGFPFKCIHVSAQNQKMLSSSLRTPPGMSIKKTNMQLAGFYNSESGVKHLRQNAISSDPLVGNSRDILCHFVEKSVKPMIGG